MRKVSENYVLEGIRKLIKENILTEGETKITNSCQPNAIPYRIRNAIIFPVKSTKHSPKKLFEENSIIKIRRNQD